MTRSFFNIMVSGLVLVAWTGCADDPCPVGQVELNGECVDLVTGDGTPLCSPLTTLIDGQCWPVEEVCGPNTELVWVVDEFGVQTNEFYCEGKGGENRPPECPEQSGDLICVNGWARYFLDPADPTASKVMQTMITHDTTTVEVRVYDPMAYAIDSSTPPLAVAEVNPTNGTFMVEGIAVPSTEFIALVVMPVGDGTGWVFTGFPYSASTGVNVTEADAIGITEAQNEAWSAAVGDTALTAAGCAAGSTFHSCGTWIGLFGYMDENHALTTIQGVTPLNGADPMPIIPIRRSFYMSDTYDGFEQPATDADSFTNGTGIIFAARSTLGNFSGRCATGTECETAGFSFPVRLGGAATNAIFVQLEYPIGYESE